MKTMTGMAVEDDIWSQLDNIPTQDLIFALGQPMIELAETPSSEMASSARFLTLSLNNDWLPAFQGVLHLQITGL